MSSQKGNVSRTRAQKFKNSSAFKNTKYDTSQRTKNILNTGQEGLCNRCKDIIQWKIKYKKYKPLKQPATCIHCHEKTVKKAYYIVCQPCATSMDVCAKCSQKKEMVSEYPPDERTQAAEQSEMEQQIKFLSERERRTLYRLKAQGKLTEGLGIQGKEDSDEEDEDVDGVADEFDGLNCDKEGDCDNDGDSGQCDQQASEDGDSGPCDQQASESGEQKVDAYALFFD